MSISCFRQALHVGAMALVLTTTASVSIFVSADAAYAERGGNGNGNSNGNGNGESNGRDRSSSDKNDRAQNGNNSRGALASELRGLNAAHANQRALENASPNSMPGKLFVYQSEQRAVADALSTEATAKSEVDRLVALNEGEIAAEFPNGDYEAALTAAAENYDDAQTETGVAQEDVGESLGILTGGRTLSDAALAELNRLLDL